MFFVSLYIFICSFTRSNGSYVDSVIHPFNSSMPVSLAFRCQRWSSASHQMALAYHRVWNQNGEIMLCDRNFSQGNHVQQAEESLQQPRSSAGQPVCNWVFPRCLRCSYRKSLDAHRPESPSDCGLDSNRLNTYRSEKRFEQKLLKQTKHILYPTHSTRKQF
jgi:hypothetical protein